MALITVLRRWFIPEARVDEFTEKCRAEVLPMLLRQPGCVRVELYDSSIREHWVLAVTWQDAESRAQVLPRLAALLLEFHEHHRFEPEILTLRSGSAR